MSRLSFYLADLNYVNYLKNEEIKARGFSRVPDLDYGKDRMPKFLCGIVFEHKGIVYYAPISSNKTNHPTSFLIKNEKGKTLSSIRFNFMFPIPLSCIRPYDFSIIENKQYLSLVQHELSFCQSHQDDILKKAKKVYRTVVYGTAEKVKSNACDFRLLEKCCREYEAAHSPAPARAASEKVSRRDVDPEI